MLRVRILERMRFTQKCTILPDTSANLRVELSSF